MSAPRDPLIDFLRSARAVRERCQRVLDLAMARRAPHFRVDLGKLGAAADLVAQVTREQYPALDVPLHSRWPHFDAGGVRRSAELDARLAGRPPLERARAKLDLVVVSVLLDAGAGPAWRYHEAETGLVFARSEGLAVASLRMFLAGAFSSDPADPLRADAAGLRALDEAALARGMQASAENPLVGLAGRLSLLRSLGAALPRPGALLDRIAAAAPGGSIAAGDVLGHVLEALGSIWPGRLVFAGVNLGDVWPYPPLSETNFKHQLVPFHKLSQWLAYSLVAPLAEAGVTVTQIDQLTGLPEYRNGGLFIDTEVLVPRSPRLTGEPQPPWSEPIVEWRALTVALLDKLAPLVRERLGRTAAELPLGAVLQGGTWAAGRRLAEERRRGAPPIRVESDGTIF